MTVTTGKNIYAHSRRGEAADRWQTLEDHLRGTADLAASFAEPFGMAECGRIAGLMHDIGKSTPEWQRYIRESSAAVAAGRPRPEKIPHAGTGARFLSTRFTGLRGYPAVCGADEIGTYLAFPVEGHHRGLTDGPSQSGGPLGPDDADIVKAEEALPEIFAAADIDSAVREYERILAEGGIGTTVRDAECDPKNRPWKAQFSVRMLMSALVDADRLDTERFMSPARADARAAAPASDAETIGRMIDAADAYIAALEAKAGEEGGPLAAARRDVREACIEAADADTGIFGLQLGTGAGKTLSSLSFALRHALRNGQRRVIYVVPFISVTEQIAGVFREVFEPVLGEGCVLEHHSGGVQGEEPGGMPMRLAVENWDAPIVVTTAVQFFESLFAASPSKCRKLHNIAASCVVLDEVQSLPKHALSPCFQAVEELARAYNTTTVLCTATQLPAERFFRFGTGIKNIVPPERSHADLFSSRVSITGMGMLDMADLADMIVSRCRERGAALAIVNSRACARTLAALLAQSSPADPAGSAAGFAGATSDGIPVYHLSARMTSHSRRRALASVNSLLAAGRPVIAVSTSLIEAGVDIDFPVVFRERNGLDSILQSAGRCNREGGLECGDVCVFGIEGSKLGAEVKNKAKAADRFLSRCAGGVDPEVIADYYRFLWNVSGSGDVDFDSAGVGDKLALPDLVKTRRYGFEACAGSFHLIDDGIAVPVFVPEDAGAERIAAVVAGSEDPGEIRAAIRGMQGHMVSVYPGERARLEEAGAFAAGEGPDGILMLDPAAAARGAYSAAYGIDPDFTAGGSPAGSSPGPG